MRSLSLYLALVVMVTVFGPVGFSTAGETTEYEKSGKNSEPNPDAKARFLVRIQELMDEAERLEKAGKPSEAIRAAVRASQMLKFIGGERVWPGKVTPANQVAQLTEKYSPEELSPSSSITSSPNKGKATSPIEKQPEMQVPAAGGGEERTAAAPVPAGISSSEQLAGDETRRKAFSRFPRLPALRQSWVPVGAATTESDEWTGIDEKGKPVAGPITATDVEFPSVDTAKPILHPVQNPLFERTLPEEGALDDRSVPAQLDPSLIEFPAELPILETPDFGYRESDESDQSGPRPIEIPSEPVPAVSIQSEMTPTTRDQNERPSNTVASTGGNLAKPESGRSHPVETVDSKSDGGSLIFATMIGALAGVLLVLGGGIIRQRLAREIAVAVPHAVSQRASTLLGPEPHTAGNDLPDWEPGTSWSSDTNSETTRTSDFGEKAEPKLQLFTGENATNELKTPPASAESAEPAVPFRVIGTSVVLGEAASAVVDEEVERRRESTLRAVLENNVAMRDRLAGDDHEELAA